MIQTAGPKLLDSCPNCLRRDIKPSTSTTTTSGRHATYRCPKCHHAWTCDWAAVDWTPEADPDPDTREVDDDFRDYDQARWPD